MRTYTMGAARHMVRCGQYQHVHERRERDCCRRTGRTHRQRRERNSILDRHHWVAECTGLFLRHARHRSPNIRSTAN